MDIKSKVKKLKKKTTWLNKKINLDKLEILSKSLKNPS